MPESQDTQNRFASVVDHTRLELAKEFGQSEALQFGLIQPNVEVRSPTFEQALPEMLAHSQKARLTDLKLAVDSLGESTKRLLQSAEESGRASVRLYRVTPLLLTVALVALTVAVVQILR